MDLPKKRNGNVYNILELNEEQNEIAATVFRTIEAWMNRSADYKPLRMTVCAGAGRGKSYLIHQLTTMIRTMFNRTDTVMTAAFTGSAAFNVNGKTCHSAFGISATNPNEPMTEHKRIQLLQQLRYIVAIFIDERSMLTADILGAAKRNVSMTCHGGSKQDLDWGGVPVVILWGDDYQLPPVDIRGKGKGAFYCYDERIKRNVRNCVKTSGMLQFQQFSETVMQLTKQQRTADSTFERLQDKVRIGDVNDSDAEKILGLNIHKQNNETRKTVESDPTSIYIFAKKQQCEEYNFQNLIRDHSEMNPIAVIKSKIPKSVRTSTLDIMTYPKATLLCREARVCIKGRNFIPEWGLFHGSIGTVKDIVFRPNENPNNGDLPLYVLVDFTNYTGPPFINTRPTWIPIPTISITERRKTSIHCPLLLSYARTIHTFQGYQAGPDQPVQKLICDVGSLKNESMWPGLLYTALSRATTIGGSDTNQSAIFFNGLDKERVQGLRGKNKDHTYTLVQKRDVWVKKLQAGIDKTRKKTENMNNGNDIARSLKTSYSIQELGDRTTKST